MVTIIKTEFMKLKRYFIVWIGVSLMLLTVLLTLFTTMADDGMVWVTDIAPHGAMNYKYTLVAYNESGNAKDVTFETSKVLTDGAYLCLKVAPIRGVVTWAEMQFDELPSSVQEKYKE